MLSRRNFVDIMYSGTNITKELDPYLEGFEYVDIASGASDTIKITLGDYDRLWTGSWLPKEGDSVEATIKTMNYRYENDEQSLFCGTFIVDDLGVDSSSLTLTIGCISTPQGKAFSETSRTRTWEKVTLQEIAQSLAANAGLAIHYDAPPVSIKVIEQSEKPDEEFLYETCKKYGLAMKGYNDKIIIFDEVQYESKSSVFTLTPLDFETGWNGNISLTGVYVGAKVKYASPKKGKKLSYEYRIGKGDKILEVNEKADSLADAMLKAKGALREANKSQCTVSGLVMPGNLNIVAGITIELQDFYCFSGKYYIDKVVHTSDDGLSTSIDVHRILGF